jgi:hypothetical protein
MSDDDMDVDSVSDFGSEDEKPKAKVEYRHYFFRTANNHF